MRWLLALLSLLTLAAPALAGERIGVPQIGIALTAPDGWQRISADEAGAHLADVRLGRDFQLQASRSGKPIISLRQARVTEPSGVLPILNVMYRPLVVDRTPGQVMERLVLAMRDRFADFRILDRPGAMTISGLPAAHVRVGYTQEQRGTRTPSVSEYWIVVRGDYYFVFASGYGPDVPPETRAVIRAAVESVRIEAVD